MGRSEKLDITLQNMRTETYHGRTYVQATDQHGREWNWDYIADPKSDAERDWDISYQDKDGIRHEHHEKDGTWYDTRLDRDGNVHSVEASDSYILTEADVRGFPDNPFIGDVLKGGPTSIATPPDDPMYTLPPPPDQVIDQLQRDQSTRIVNPDPPVATRKLGYANVPEDPVE